MSAPDFGNLPPLLNDYLMYIDAIKNRSSKTVSEYALNLKEFITFILNDRNNSPDYKPDLTKCDEIFFKSITLNDAYKYLSYCKNNKKNSAATRSRKASAIRQFFKYLTDNRRILEGNPMEILDSPKIKKTLPKYLTLEQSVELLNSVDGKNRERDYAILTIFLNCGLRLSELVGLNFSDINLKENTVRILGKGGKERMVYLNDACVSALESYLKIRPREGVKDKDALFLSNRLERVSSRTVQHIVETFLKKSGLDNLGFSTHKLRHTAATLMYQYGGADVLVLKDILGHENLSTTEIYTHLADSKKKEAIDNNPLSNIDKIKKK